MKNNLLVILLFAAVFPLAAQAGKPISIYVPEVTGYGISPSDNHFITGMLRSEVRARNYVAASSPGLADFHLTGSLVSYVEGGENQKELSILHVALKNIGTGEIIAEQRLVYSDLNIVNDQFALMMFNLFSQNLGAAALPPPKPPVRENWLDKRLYFGAGVFWTPRFYYGTELSVHFANFGGEVSAEIHFHPLLSFETGVAFTPDWVVVSYLPGDYYHDLMLEIPLLIKYVAKARDINLVEPYGGFQLNFSLFRETKPFPVSFSAGCLFGLKSEKGFFYLDPRVSVDLGRSDFFVANSVTYHRTLLHIGVGYKTGAFSR